MDLQTKNDMHARIDNCIRVLTWALADAAEAAAKRGATLTAHNWDRAREVLLRLDSEAISEAQAMWIEDNPHVTE